MIDNYKYHYEVKRESKYVPTSEKDNALDNVREQLDWIRRQLEYASFTEKFRVCFNLKKGEIYEFDWGINVNCEFSSRHYGVVLQDSDEKNPLVVVCPLKSNKKGYVQRGNIDLGKIEGIPTPYTSIAVVNQIRTLDKVRIYTKNAIGEVKEIEEGPISVLSAHDVNRIIVEYSRYLFTGYRGEY